MEMTRTDGSIIEAAGPFFDVLEDILRLDDPIRPSMRRRVRAANEDALRTLRQLGAEDEQLIAPQHARTICNAIAQRHGIKPRFMLSMRELGEQLTLEFASALMPSATRARLISSAVQLEDRGAGTDPARRRGSDQRPDPRVEWVALAQAVLALASMVVAFFMARAGRGSLGLELGIVSVATLAFARAALAISADRRARSLTGDDTAGRAEPGATVEGAEIDLRSTGL